VKILVTGANGFIGSHLVESLVQRNHEVVALCEYNSYDSKGWLDQSKFKSEIRFKSGDVRDSEFIRQVIQGFDAVYHLAALISIPYSYVAPRSFFEVNLMGTMNVLEAINSGNNGLLIHTSTSETYGTAKYSPIDEIHPMQPQSPYSASKIAADALVRSFFHSFGTPVVVARPFNTYGPRQSPRAVIPTILLQALQSENPIMLGDLKPKRSFNYVEDTVSQLVLMSEKSSQLKLGDVYNLGVDEVYSIEELVKIIEKVLDTKLEIKFDPERMRPVASEVYLLSSDSSKIRECLGKISRTPMELGIEKFVNWLRNGGLKKYNSNDLHWNPL
jgi:NAD dependent epimerase/dehydratase